MSARPPAAINLGPSDPDPQRLVIDVQLLRDRPDRFPLRRILVLMLQQHPHRSLSPPAPLSPLSPLAQFVEANMPTD